MNDQRDPPRCLWLESRVHRVVLHLRAVSAIQTDPLPYVWAVPVFGNGP